MIASLVVEATCHVGVRTGAAVQFNISKTRKLTLTNLYPAHVLHMVHLQSTIANMCMISCTPLG